MSDNEISTFYSTVELVVADDRTDSVMPSSFTHDWTRGPPWSYQSGHYSRHGTGIIKHIQGQTVLKYFRCFRCVNSLHEC